MRAENFMISLFPFKLKNYFYKNEWMAIVTWLNYACDLQNQNFNKSTKFIAHEIFVLYSINILKETTARKMESPPLREMLYFPYFSSPNPIKDHIQNLITIILISYLLFIFLCPWEDWQT